MKTMSVSNFTNQNNYSRKTSFGMKARPIDVIATMAEFMMPSKKSITGVFDVFAAVTGRSARRHGISHESLGNIQQQLIKDLGGKYPKLSEVPEDSAGFWREINIGATRNDEMAWLKAETKKVFGKTKKVEVPEVARGEKDSPGLAKGYDRFLYSSRKEENKIDAERNLRFKINKVIKNVRAFLSHNKEQDFLP